MSYQKWNISTPTQVVQVIGGVNDGRTIAQLCADTDSGFELTECPDQDKFALSNSKPPYIDPTNPPASASVSITFSVDGPKAGIIIIVSGVRKPKCTDL